MVTPRPRSVRGGAAQLHRRQRGRASNRPVSPTHIAVCRLSSGGDHPQPPPFAVHGGLQLVFAKAADIALGNVAVDEVCTGLSDIIVVTKQTKQPRQTDSSDWDVKIIL
ncbi:hypothetical protein H257_06552 [Aphanomyces astaci]|uniref:Uncharacterized protein n=1 Tax=Aphanomyces astaci TaxID=112090 RepID=W4GMS3_APHAT|nr:hypothetical protein H257_06552 [Aphanomyces astaci]ETV80193.1 hypothetical protein H257_06552 [Aphanomyces astaci]|eukprot:XP_009830117.1 hypothetical protein H257_06552 [Aphanomyces astaci]